MSGEGKWMLLALCMMGSANAQEVAAPAGGEKPAKVVWLHPLEASAGVVSASAELPFARSWTASVGLSAGVTISGANNPLGMTPAVAASDALLGGASAGAAWFAWGEAPFGVWVGPQLEARVSRQRSQLTPEGGTAMIASFGSMTGRLSLLAGVNARVVSGLSVQVAVGLAGTLESSSGVITVVGGESTPLQGTVFGVGTRLQVALGWAF